MSVVSSGVSVFMFMSGKKRERPTAPSDKSGHNVMSLTAYN